MTSETWINGLKNTRNGVSEVARKTGKKGGQLKNRNARTHGAYVQKWDRRTREARVMEQTQAGLISDLGGPENISVQQLLLIQRASVKDLKCRLIERAMLKSNGETGERLEQHYLRWARELRAVLVVLGLERRARPVQGLQDYLKENYGGD